MAAAGSTIQQDQYQMSLSWLLTGVAESGEKSMQVVLSLGIGYGPWDPVTSTCCLTFRTTPSM